MAENAKNDVTSDADAKKGRASKKAEEDVKVDAVQEGEVSAEKAVEETAVQDGDVTEEAEPKPRKAKKTKTAKAAAKKVESVKADDVMREDCSAEEFQEEIRTQIENCKNELQITLEQSVKQEFSAIVKKQMKSMNRRRRFGVVVRDIIILFLAVMVGYFGWCLYDAKYFDWMGPKEGAAQDEQEPKKDGVDEPTEVVKDTRWYINNYGYLFEDLQLGLNADNVEAYYLYSDDYRVSEIKPAYLLGMAYNKVMPATSSTATNAANETIAAADLRTAFEGMFGTLDMFEKTSFTHGCKKFAYMRDTDSFVTENGDCTVESKRKIVEEINEMYEEGNVLYVLTTAAIYDESEASFYNFDDLFEPKVMNVAKEDLTKNQVKLNRYQYQFKKTGEKYHFSGIIKLQ